MPTNMTDAWDDATLQAYHDHELGFWARWRVERSLARSPELRRTLAEIATLGDLVRASEAPVRVPDLWDSIAPGLRIADAEREQGSRASGWTQPFGSFAGLGARVGALAAAGAAAVALAFVLLTDQTAPHGVVHWVDSGDRNVMLMEGEGDVTVIWVLDSASDRALGGGRRGTA